MRPEALKYLYDMQQACRLLAAFLDGKTFDDDADDVFLRLGKERQLIFAGEATNRLAKIKPALGLGINDARQIVAFRNILVHGYDIVRIEVVWGILETDLVALNRDVNTLFERGRAEETRGEFTDGESSG